MKVYPLDLIDWYKANHIHMYPPGTTKIVSNNTPRKSRIPGVDHIIWFGLQYFLKEYLVTIWNDRFFNQPIDSIIKKYKRRCDTSLGPNSVGVNHIIALHKLGYLPLKIMALPEGSKVPIRVAPMIMWNTHPEFFWLTNYFETILSSSLWQACTSATLAREYRRRFDADAIKTGGSLDFVPFQGHDFSFRGMSSLETACLSGAGHLLSFAGTDTVPAIDFLEEYYNADAEKELIGASVPATEHSVMCVAGKEDEISTFKRLLELYPSGILSVVSDTWDLWKVLTEYLPTLYKEIMSRDGKLVIRPDSGDPADILCGRPNKRKDGKYYEPATFYRMEMSESEAKGVVELLWDVFGGVVNSKGFKELDSHIGCIYGDSISLAVRDDISARLEAKGFASTNWVAGIGSFTYQYNTRDTQGWAVKATYAEVDCEGKCECREIFKDPITDDGMKKSAKGLIAVYEQDGTFVMKDQVSWKEVENCAYKTVFEDGKLVSDQTLSEIRQRVLNS